MNVLRVFASLAYSQWVVISEGVVSLVNLLLGEKRLPVFSNFCCLEMFCKNMNTKFIFASFYSSIKLNSFDSPPPPPPLLVLISTCGTVTDWALIFYIII